MKSIVKESKSVREKLQARIKELNLSLTDVCKDAVSRGMNISVASLSKYFKQSDRNNLTEENIIWLCYRYGIFVLLTVGSPKVSDGKLTFSVDPYNEEKCLMLLNRLFPNVKKEKGSTTKKKSG